MNSNLRFRVLVSAAVAGVFGWAAPAAHAQAFYSVSKSQGYFQNSSGAPVADPSQPFNFSASAAVNTTFTAPAGTVIPLNFSSGDQSYKTDLPFATKADLDAAFPNGVYRMSGGGIAPLSFNLATENYPAATPQITSGGTWVNGVLVVNPAQTTTLTFTTFATYATAGVAGHMEIRIRDFSSSAEPVSNQAASVAVAGITPSSTPLTTIVIPAGALTNGRLYTGEVQFDTITTLDTTTVSGGVAVGIFTKGLRFYVSAQATGSNFPLPVIIAQPTNQTAVAGGRATFNLGVTVGGVAPTPNSSLSIFWSFNGQQLNIDGNKYSFIGGGLTINNVMAADAGSYSAMIIAPGGLVTSSTATLTLGAAPTPVAPTIPGQPVSKNVSTGSTVVFSVVANGSVPLTYQWRKDGQNVANGVNGVSGGNGATLVINGANATTAGVYSVVVTNSVNSATSSNATLTVTSTNDPGRLTNLSVLTDITAGSSFTVGTVIGGAGTSGSKALVVRAVGPSLGALGVPGTIGDPQLTFFNGSSVAVASNDNWGSDASTVTALTNAMVSVGAFAFTGSASKDAMVFQPSLTPGNYSVAVSGVSGSTGTAIAEIYDATPVGTFTPLSSRLVNVSVLKSIPSGGLLTLGFTIGGATAKTVLIRVVGPGLAAVGVTSGTLADPQLTLFNSLSTQIASNDDWGADPQLINAGARVNAFAIGNTQSKDAMLIVTLPAGGYTAQAKGGGGTSGLAIVEVYEVP